MTAPDIPEDIQAAARSVWQVLPVSHIEMMRDPIVDAIALALLSERTRATEAERERCAKIAEDEIGTADGGDFGSGQISAAAAIRASIRTEGTAK